MNIVDRAKNICLTPKTEWPVVEGEAATNGGLITSYVLPLAAIGAVAGFIGSVVVGYSIPFVGGTVRTGVVAGLVTAVLAMAFAVAAVFILSLIIDALAPSFGGQKNPMQAMKVAVYSYTPAWLAGILSIIPMLGILGVLISLYGFYLLYLGLQQLMKSPQDKAIGYTVVVVICAIVVSVILSVIVGLFAGAGMMAKGAMTGGISAPGATSSANVTFDKDSALGKLGELGKKMEEANKKVEAAKRSGDKDAEAKAGMEALGVLLGGGKKVEPLALEQLKPFVPETFAGLPKISSKTERTGVASLMVATAEATYQDGDKRVTLDISDSGGATGLMGLASWAMVQNEREDDNGREKTGKVDGRMVKEKSSKQPGGSNEYSVVLGERFVVAAHGNGVDLATLKKSVAGLDLAKLEGMKNVGVSQ